MPDTSDKANRDSLDCGNATGDEVIDRLYSAYPNWKTHYEHDTPETRGAQFATEIGRVGLPPKARIVEVGFGGGVFLDWARSAGFEAYGVERNETFCQRAQERGHRVVCGTLQELDEKLRGQVDLILCFDVLEHLSVTQILQLLNDTQEFLTRNGKFIARFPNGASPFGRLPQHGDHTHKTILSADSMAQLAALEGYRLISAHNAARPMAVAGRSRWWDNVFLRRCVYGLRDLVNIFLSGLYFGKKVPMDPNVTIILQRQELEPDLKDQ